jgi:AbrB family looped-hinge helix DNA binding protein
MSDTIVPIDKAGRVVLPKDIRDELSIKSGDMLRVSIQGSSVMLIPDRESGGLVRKGRGLVFCPPGDDVLAGETVGRIIESHRDERHRRASGGLPGRGNVK